ncbi:hypothetical protein BsWGS_22901 [Bradybaena similaris]
MATYERESIKAGKVSSVPDDSMSLAPFVSLCDLFSMLDLELGDSSLRTEIQRCLEMLTVDFDDYLPMEIKKADRWLEWAGNQKYLKLMRTSIPDFILPKNFSGELIDVKVFCKHGPDDKIYDSYKMVRDKVARGNCFLHLTRGPYTGSLCVLHALKKFTGGLGDDDDKDKGDNITWRNYFLKPIEMTETIIATKKANGEAAHLSCVLIDEHYYICGGSKNVHMLIRNREDIAAYRGDRYRIASEVCHTIMDCLEGMKPVQKQRLLHFLCVTRLTAVFEILSPLHQHVEDLSYLNKPILQFIAWTTTNLEPMPEHHLCAFPPHVGIEIAKALGLSAVEYELLGPSHLLDKMKQIRQGYQFEGEVLYFLDNGNHVIGLLKKKTVWYIICRALREKARSSGAAMIKQRRLFSVAKSVKQVEQRLNEIQSWLGLSDSEINQWKNIGIAFLKWTIKQMELQQLSVADIVEKFPSIW